MPTASRVSSRVSRDVWLVVGASPGIEMYYAALCPMLSRLATITSNAGARLFAQPYRPDFYWVSDPAAVSLFAGVARDLQRRGTKLIGVTRPVPGSQRPQVYRPDVVVPLPHRGGGPLPFTPGRWVHPRLSGLLCLQYALHAGARAVVLAGMCGYASTRAVQVVDEVDGRLGPRGGNEYNGKWIAPFVQSCIDALPAVRFVVCGRPLYELRGPNMKVLDSPDQVARAVADLVGA